MSQGCQFGVVAGCGWMGGEGWCGCGCEVDCCGCAGDAGSAGGGVVFFRCAGGVVRGVPVDGGAGGAGADVPGCGGAGGAAGGGAVDETSSSGAWGSVDVHGGLPV
jgi:hypothetical protein